MQAGSSSVLIACCSWLLRFVITSLHQHRIMSWHARGYQRGIFMFGDVYCLQ